MRTLDYPRREVYPHAPLQLVAAEIRYPYAPRLRRPETLDALQIDLEQRLPIRRQMQQMSVEFSSAGAVNQQNEEVFRLFNRASTKSASVTPTVTTVEATDYSEFPDFLDLVEAVLTAIDENRGPAAVERVGLRYIDEVRIPDEVKSAKDWEGWISPDITSMCNFSPGEPSGYQGVIESNTGNDQKLVLRFAALEGVGVVGNDPLQRKTNPESGPFFVIDVDSFWEAGTPNAVTDFDVKNLVSRFEELHMPTGRAFQGTLTDKLRELFRNGVK